MKLNFITLLFFVFALIAVSEMSAQDSDRYKSAVGLRFGSPYVSASYKTFIKEGNALEFYASFRSFSGYSWVSASGAYQIHKPLDNIAEGLQWYYGGGASVYFWTFDSGFISDAGSISVGINGYLGLDYKFKNAPVSLTTDWVPTFFVNGFGSGFGGGYGGLGIRYVLN